MTDQTPHTPAPRTEALRAGVRGVLPLTARLEPWMTALLADPDACLGLLAEHGSPVNVLDTAALRRNADELVEVGRRHGVEVRVHVARKANKAIAVVRAAVEGGHGVDVASLAELRQALAAGAPGERILVTAAVKPPILLAEAVAADAIVSLDTVAELHAVAAAATELGRTARVMPRLAPAPSEGLRPTRFGERSDTWVSAAAAWPAGVSAVGVHVHLDGYAAENRLRALTDVFPVTDALVAAGQPVEFVDLGGGIPMSYLDDAAEWDAFWAAMAAEHEPEALTWRDHPLGKVYPYHQRPTRADWLAGLVAQAGPALAGRGLRLHLEPGRSVLDGCGLTLARVAFVKERSDGVPLVGLEMNRTQCRSTSDDFLVDPILVRTQGEGEPTDGFLVGAYCIEDELILLRRLHFPHGVRPGDVIALPNTGGYLMHILESASHQIPLARNVVRTDAGFVLDEIDR